MYTREREIAIAAVREASIICRAVQAQISSSVLEKKDKSPVTVADFGSQALVCRAIREAFAGDPIIAEEDSAALREAGQSELLARVVSHVNTIRPGVSADTVCQWIDFGGANAYSKRFWTLDPIDGTKGFLRSEQYAIALALIVDGEIVVSALGCPNLPVSADRPDKVGVIFAAVKGEGAVAIELDSDAAPVAVRVSDLADSRKARFCESVESGHSSHDDSATVGQRLGITAEAVRMDSQAKYATVARGDADIYLRLPTRAGYVEKIWDHAAGVLVITEAGGRVTDINGKPLEFTHGSGLEKNKGVIVTNGHLHDAVLEALNAVGVAV